MSSFSGRRQQRSGPHRAAVREEPALARSQEFLSLARTDSGTFEALFPGTVPQAQAQTVLEQLDAEYTRLVQERVYEQVVERAQQQGLALESERVEEDNSIVLTLRVEQSG